MSMRVHLTERCNAACAYCFNAHLRNHEDMDIARYRQVLPYLRANGVGHLRIMGGEPTVHPQFVEAYQLAQEHFPVVSLFTNALNDKIFSVEPRSSDYVIYNFAFIDERFDVTKLLPKAEGFTRIFEILIGSDTDIGSLHRRIEHTHNECKALGIKDKHINFQLTLNCVENIFAHREGLNKAYLDTVHLVLSLVPHALSYDHIVPYCFWLPDSIREFQQLGLGVPCALCRETCIGLIDSKFSLCHCDHYLESPITVFEEKDGGLELVDFDVALNSLLRVHFRKRILNLDKACAECSHFNWICDGGCFIHKGIVPQMQHVSFARTA